MKKILFISHDASRTGAPMIVLYILQWFKKNHSEILIDTVLVSGGRMEEAFINSSNKLYNYKSIVNSNKAHNKYINKLVKKVRNSDVEKRFFNELVVENYDVIYANSVVSLPLASKIKSKLPKSILVSHLHELEDVIKDRIPKFDSFTGNVDLFIAPSDLVKNNLINKHKIKEENLVIIRDFSKLKKMENASIPFKNFTVGACGTISIRKGFDLFIQVALFIKKKSPDSEIDFVWIGGNKSLIEVAKSDVIKAGLGGVVNFVGEQTDLMSFFKSFDVFLLTSREDPFPLVCIDVASLSKPIICFNDATGTAEVLKNGGGHIVPYLDAEEMSLKVIDYYNDRISLLEDGRKAKELFSEFTPDKICPIIFNELKSLVEK